VRIERSTNWRRETVELNRGTWGRFAVRVLVLGVVVFGAVRLAVARDGVAGGASRSFVTVAGTLTGVTGAGVGLTFSFRRALGDGGVAPALCAPTVATTVREGGAFSAEVPLASDASRCPDDLFDGRDVVVEVAVNGTPINGRFSVNPVPYAIRADVANAAGGQLETRLAALDTRVTGVAERLTTRALLARNTGAWTLLSTPTNVRRIDSITNNRVRVYFNRAYRVGGGGVTTATPSVSVSACGRCIASYSNNVGESVDVAVHELVTQVPSGPDAGPPRIAEVEPSANPYEVSILVDGLAAP